MRVLWFANTPANSVHYLRDNSVNGGWLEALDKYMQCKVDLHVAFYYPRRSMQFKHLDCTYHPIAITNWWWDALRASFFNYMIDDRDLMKYLDIVEKVQPDIIHIHGTENSFNCLHGKTTVPIVVSIQGNITAYEKKFFSGIERKYARLRIFPKNWKDCLFKKSYLSEFKQFQKMRKREIKHLQHASFIMGRTAWDRRITSVLAPNSKYYVCQEILRDSFYNAQWTPHNNRSRLVLHSTTGNNLYKGFETICEVINILSQFEFDFEWRVAGISANDSIVKVVNAKLGRQYPKSNLVLLGRLKPEQLVGRLLEADLYVMPSHIENSPNSLCEAMILGMPCIATHAGGTSSLLTDGIDGVLIQDGDPWSMAGAILELYRAPRNAWHLGARARIRALHRHNPTDVAESLVNSYHDILSSYSQI